MNTTKQTLDWLQSQFGDLTVSEFREQTRVDVDRSLLHDVLSGLKNEQGFDLLVDVTCVDYLHYRGAESRFGLVYLLANTITAERVTVRTRFDETDAEAPTATDLWQAANWLEREAYDMFGVAFTGHPDLRRILLPEEFTSHPLRKDYPLQGRGERHNFTAIRRKDA